MLFEVKDPVRRRDRLRFTGFSGLEFSVGMPIEMILVLRWKLVEARRQIIPVGVCAHRVWPAGPDVCKIRLYSYLMTLDNACSPIALWLA